MTTQNDSMPIPSWVDNAREEMLDAHQGMDYDNAKVTARDMSVVTDFSNLFAEYEIRDSDLLVHIFARNGGKDRYWPSELKKDGTRIEGRLELSGSDAPDFPNDIVNRIKIAVDKVWQGDVAIDKATVYRYEKDDDVAEDDPVERDMKAYSVQFQGAANTAHVVGLDKFMDQFCEALDVELG